MLEILLYSCSCSRSYKFSRNARRLKSQLLANQELLHSGAGHSSWFAISILHSTGASTNLIGGTTAALEKKETSYHLSPLAYALALFHESIFPYVDAESILNLSRTAREFRNTARTAIAFHDRSRDAIRKFLATSPKALIALTEVSDETLLEVLALEISADISMLQSKNHRHKRADSTDHTSQKEPTYAFWRYLMTTDGPVVINVPPEAIDKIPSFLHHLDQYQPKHKPSIVFSTKDKAGCDRVQTFLSSRAQWPGSWRLPIYVVYDRKDLGDKEISHWYRCDTLDILDEFPNLRPGSSSEKYQTCTSP